MFSKANDPEGAFPRLKGRAGEVKHLSKALLFVFDNNKDPDSQIHAMISLLMRRFIAMDDILDAYPPHVYPKLPLEEAAAFENAGFEALACLTHVADHFMRVEPLQLFNITIKAHYIVHIAVNAKFLNPRMAMCYGNEDYMHHMKRLVSMSIRGTKASDASKKISDKIRHAWHQQMSR